MRTLVVRRGIGIAACFAAAAAIADGVTPESVSETVLGSPAPTWFIAKGGLGSAYVFDAADGEMRGTLSLTPWTPTVRRHPGRNEIYAAETHYSRRFGGERSDVLRIYEHATLNPVAEIDVPDKITALHTHYLAILSGGRYVTVFNMTPAQSVSVVDVEDRRFVGEISTPGCALTLPAGERGFLMMCGDGTLQWIGLDEAGAETARVRSEPFFSVDEDPMFDEPVETPAGWQFLSFEGLAVEASVDGGQIVVGESWSVLGEDDEGWRPGGSQPIAYHAGHDLLVVLMHEGKEDTQDQDGTEAWVFHREAERRIGRIKFEEGMTAGSLLVVEADRRADKPAEEPLLLAAIAGGVRVFGLRTGKRERIIESTGGGSLLRY